MIELTSQQVREKIESGEKFLLDYYATWCGPCRVLKQNLVSIELEIEIPIYTYNIDSDPNFTRESGVRSVPTLKFFDKSKIINTGSGVMSHTQIKSFITT